MEHEPANPATRERNTSRLKAKKKNGRRRTLKDKKVWGYDATLAVARNPHYGPKPQPNGCGDPNALPALILGFTLDKPGAAPGRNGARVLENVSQRGYQQATSPPTPPTTTPNPTTGS